jgi:hypothetical protein
MSSEGDTCLCRRLARSLGTVPFLSMWYAKGAFSAMEEFWKCSHFSIVYVARKYH